MSPALADDLRYALTHLSCTARTETPVDALRLANAATWIGQQIAEQDQRCALLVCGGRNFNDTKFAFSALDRAMAKRPISLLIHGAATGADSIAEAWAKQRRIPYLGVPAQWHIHGKSAGHRRNARMLDMAYPDALIAFPGGKGTADMIAKATQRQISIWEPKYTAKSNTNHENS